MKHIAYRVWAPVVCSILLPGLAGAQGWQTRGTVGTTVAVPVGTPTPRHVGPPAGVVATTRTVNVGLPPPPPRQDAMAPPPAPGQVWVPGYWAWNGSQYQWVSGHWEAPPQPGAVWVPPQWNRRARRYMYMGGHWETDSHIPANTYTTGRFGIPTTPQAHQIGTVVTGSLDASDYHLPQGGYADDYAMYLQAGRPVTIVVTGGPSSAAPGQLLDVVASVHFNGQVLAQDDDGAGYPHARLVFTPQITGVYELRVTSYGSRYETGMYTVQSWPGAVANAMPFAVMNAQYGVNAGPAPQQAWQQPQQTWQQPQQTWQQPQQTWQQPPPGAVPAARPLTLGTAVTATLGAGSSPIANGSFVDDYQVVLQPGETVTLVARGGPTLDGQGRLDMVLDVLFNGAVVAHDDDSAGNLDSRVIFTARAPGPYTVRVRTFGSAPRGGQYTLTAWRGAFPGAR